MGNEPAGFEELPHTADWAIRVWAPRLEDLLEQAARGMYTLSGIETGARLEETSRLVIEATDMEGLLVDFLQELLYRAESRRLAYPQLAISITDFRLEAEIKGGPIVAWKKEIKAVTYHNLEIRQTERGLETEIVFDV